MGVDCVAIMPHSLSHPQQLDVSAITSGACMTQITRLWVEHHSNSSNWTRVAEWAISPEYSSLDEEWGQQGWVHLDLPGGFHLGFGKRMIELYHVTRWGNFVTDAQSRVNFRGVCRELALLLGSMAWVYV